MSDERARLFVALQVPAEVREALGRWRSQVLQGLDGVRLVGDDDLHATLCFLGWRAMGEIEAILDACRVAEGFAVTELRARGSLWLPPRRPRVLAVEFEDAGGALGRVQAALSEALAAGGWYEPEARPFLAHVTVARVGRGARLRGVDALAPPDVAFTGSSVALYRSRLSPAGARYETLGTVPLGDGSAAASG